ncbi:MAG: amino acid ABC transporter permease [Candidatus Neomarinimicrobiota bacterium]|jgi:glutamate/aspartate transport system permease protein|nr:amino acid ABC transporter permease [Candidatus Neomarinimicrobiota bacterium]|tara:strand:- start:1251 stop:1973 length:723 start_codon:yes stop_codon:yes gene_type:complete
MQYNWDWGVIIREPYLEWIISGFGWTVSVSIAAWLLAFSLGSIIGIFRTTNNSILRAIAAVYVEIFRNIPLIVQMFLWYFVFPELLPNEAGMWVKREMPMPEFTTAALCLGLYTASRVAEQVRSGIQSIGQGQNNAGLATGLTKFQVYRYILLPVGYRIMIPPLTSEFLTIFKNSSVALTIGVLEITAQARQIEEYTFQGFEAFTTATVLYILVTSIVMILMRVVEGKVSIPGMISLGAK